MRKCNLFIPKVWLRTDYSFRPFRTCYLVVFCSEMFFDLSFCLISCDLLEIVSLNWRSSKLSRGLITTNHRMTFFFYNIYKTNTTYNTNIILTYICIYNTLLILTLFIQANRTNTYSILTILTLYLHLHCTTHTYTICTSTKYNQYI